MEVLIFPNSSRPGVGLKPRRESQRPLLAQHARHCPVLEAGSALGFLVYPPLEEHEAFHVGYQGEGRYRFVYYVNPTARKWEAVFSVAMVFPIGGIGMFRQEVTFLTRVPTTSQENALLMARTFFVPEDIGTPPGALSCGARGIFRRRPAGTGLRPSSTDRAAAQLPSVRRDRWCAHETGSLRLQPGEVSGGRNMPIGQVFFVPRQDISLRECNAGELAAIRESAEGFSREKAAVKLTTPYGLTYSPHYLRTSRAHSAVVPTVVAAERAPDVQVDQEPVSGEQPRSLGFQRTDVDTIPFPAVAPTGRVRRNDPCPCGSGKKYKKCHGDAA
jgi:hypothetical protein